MSQHIAFAFAHLCLPWTIITWVYLLVLVLTWVWIIPRVPEGPSTWCSTFPVVFALSLPYKECCRSLLWCSSLVNLKNGFLDCLCCLLACSQPNAMLYWSVFWVAFTIYLYLLYGGSTHVNMPIVQHVHGGQRIVGRNWFSPSMWVLGIKIKLSAILLTLFNLTSFIETELSHMWFCGLVWSLMVRLKVRLLKMLSRQE